ncbi:hypothetical protein [Sphingobacterium faecium]|jgi:hypothetical protein|uniref:hypothetical protein n=1 Tax=Sphingobacterium faecium TaxID=34087 RepID=UPI000D4E41EC|nr:hypothetical protein [Sphingobacterium faecium]PTX11947.1 hypothetical protein C8N37_103524 [Sphingobacterium faecium]
MMKNFILLVLIALTVPLYGQNMNLLEKKLNELSEQRTKWSDSHDDKAYDSLVYYNQELEKFILDFTSNNSKTLQYPFKNIRDNIDIVTSKDGLFRIYTWNTLEGGTMQFFQNVYQYSHNGKVYAQLDRTPKNNDGYDYYDINDVRVGDKYYYMTSRVSRGSSALFYYQAKIFSIENGKLNPDEKLIKTKTGINNTLGYEVDLSSLSNRNRLDNLKSSDYKLTFDSKSKTIILPLIQADGYITKRKIKYQLKTNYFEKVD